MVSGRGGERPAPAARPGRDPLVTLLRELARRESISYLRVEKGDDLVVVATCGLTTYAASSSTWTARSSTAAPTSAPRPLPGAVEVLDGDPRLRDARSCCSPTGATSAPRRSPRACATAGSRSPTTSCSRPVCSALSYLARRHPGRPAMVFGSQATREPHGSRRRADRATASGADVVFVAHVDEVDLAAMERAARAVSGGARLLTANYQPGYWGAGGIVFSRGAMVTAAIAKAAGARPIVVGKPSHAAVREVGAAPGRAPAGASP